MQNLRWILKIMDQVQGQDHVEGSFFLSLIVYGMFTNSTFEGPKCPPF